MYAKVIKGKEIYNTEKKKVTFAIDIVTFVLSDDTYYIYLRETVWRMTHFERTAQDRCERLISN